MNLPLEKQVCARELSEKLRDLGVPQESYFIYVNTEIGGKPHLLTKGDSTGSMLPQNFFSAFTLAELGHWHGKGKRLVELITLLLWHYHNM